MVPSVAKYMIKLRILRGGAYCRLSKWAQYNYRGPYKEEGERCGEIIKRRRGEVVRGWRNVCDHKTRNAVGIAGTSSFPKASTGSMALLTP